ncbi:hypothetical protein [Nocardioides bruguierae]|uniref:N-acetyltransferase n=1 Tax=Nocardioides bruguierae TaxID=2945102 RepID=A0A9X2DAK4_9ACTN|nr:hypothetical protein [Nocardioides bruguierae]MCM0622338.1 hypothetical protein [Nocardioides bruguierae]
MTVSLALTRLTAEEAPGFDLGAFSCGDPSYDAWLGSCLTQLRAGSVTVFVLIEDVDQAPGGSLRPVLGYFALALTVIKSDDLSKRAAKGQDEVPAFLLARLALSADLRGGADGKNLLTAALARMVMASETVPSRLLAVDAERPKVARLYEDWGFTATSDIDGDVDPETGRYRKNVRLVAKTSSIRAALPEGSLWTETSG